MQCNSYLIGCFRRKITKYQDKTEITDSAQKTITSMKRYLMFLEGSNVHISRGQEHKCYSPQKPLAYWGCGPYIAHCFNGGNKPEWLGILQRLGFRIPSSAKSGGRGKKKKRVKYKKNCKRKVREQKTKIKPAKAKKPKKFSAVFASDFAKFELKYSKIETVQSKTAKFGPRTGAVRKNLDFCSVVFEAKVDPETDALNVLSAVSQPMKINIGADYIDAEWREKPTGKVGRDEIKSLLPIFFGVAWGISKPTINYASSYMILKPECDGSDTFIINKYFTKLMKKVKSWDKNRWHAMIMREINGLKEMSETESDLSGSNSDLGVRNGELNVSDSALGGNDNGVVSMSESVEKESDVQMENKNDKNDENENENEQNLNDGLIFNDSETEETEECGKADIEQETEDSAKADIEEETEESMLVQWLRDHDLDEEHVLDKLVRRKRPVKLHELAQIKEEDLQQYLTETLELGTIEVIRFNKLMDTFKYQLKNTCFNV